MTDAQQNFVLRFEGVNAREAGLHAAGLRETLLDTSPDVGVDLNKADGETMDFGATLILVLGTPAVLAVAKGIAMYLARERAGELVIERDGKVVFKGSSGDAARIAEALGRKPEP